MFVDLTILANFIQIYESQNWQFWGLFTSHTRQIISSDTVLSGIGEFDDFGDFDEIV